MTKRTLMGFGMVMIICAFITVVATVFGQEPPSVTEMFIIWFIIDLYLLLLDKFGELEENEWI